MLGFGLERTQYPASEGNLCEFGNKECVAWEPEVDAAETRLSTRKKLSVCRTEAGCRR